MASNRDQHLEQSYLVGSHYVGDWIRATAKCREQCLGCDRYPSFELLVWEALLGELHDVGVIVEACVWEYLLMRFARGKTAVVKSVCGVVICQACALCARE